MWSSTRRNRAAFALVIAFTWVTSPACSECGEAPPVSAPTAPVAKRYAWLEAVTGQVRIRRDGKWYKGVKGLTLKRLDAVSTGADGEAIVVFQKGTRLRLRASTTLELEDAADGVIVQLGAGELSVDLNAEDVDFKVALDRGGQRVISMNLGTIRVVRERGQVGLEVVKGTAVVKGPEGSKVVKKGTVIPMKVPSPAPARPDVAAPKPPDAVSRPVADAGPAPNSDAGPTPAPDVGPTDTPPPGDATPTADTGGPDAVGTDTASADTAPTDTVATRGPSRFTLVQRRGGAVVKGPAAANFARVPGRRSALPARSAVKARRGRVRLETRDGSRISLIRGAHIKLLGGGGPARVEVIRGSVRVGAKRPVHVHVGGRVVVVRPRGTRSEVKVSRTGSGLQVSVRRGGAHVTVGGRRIRIPVAHSVTITGDEIKGPRLMGYAEVTVREGRRTRVYYDRRPRMIGLRWKAGRGTLEVARDRSFTKMVLREELESGRFNISFRRGRRFYWRFKRPAGTGPVGHVSFATDPNLRRGRGGAARNVVRDTGRETRIYFQGLRPALTFKWRAVPGAAKYRVRLYRSGNLSRPMLTRVVRSAALALKAGRLKEGAYFWYQEALNAQGRQLMTSQMNKLSLTFDNFAPLLRIDSPRSRSRAGRTPLVTGVLGRGRRLSVNGRKIGVGAGGRFTRRIRTLRGGLLRFQIRGSRSDIYFLRHVR